MRTQISRSGVVSTLPYSHGIVASGATLYISGQGPVDVSTGSFVLGTFEEQARLTLDNLAAVAEAAGTSLAHAVKVNVYLRDMGNFPVLNTIYAEYFTGIRPARTTVQSNLQGFEIEIDAIVDVPTDR